MMGHCNVNDILKLEENVEGKLPIKINLNVKFAHKRRCRSHEIGCPTLILEMVHVDSAGPMAKDGFNYAQTITLAL